MALLVWKCFPDAVSDRPSRVEEAKQRAKPTPFLLVGAELFSCHNQSRQCNARVRLASHWLMSMTGVASISDKTLPRTGMWNLGWDSQSVDATGGQAIYDTLLPVSFPSITCFLSPCP